MSSDRTGGEGHNRQEDVLALYGADEPVDDFVVGQPQAAPV